MEIDAEYKTVTEKFWLKDQLPGFKENWNHPVNLEQS